MSLSKKYWQKKSAKSLNAAPNVSLFRLLGEYGFNFKNKKVLEVGFFHGADLMEFNKRKSLVYGLDINKNAVDNIKKKLPISHIKKSDCGKEKIPFLTKFDLIYSDQTFEHLADPGKVIKSLIGLLNKNGCFFFKVPPGRFFKRKLNENYLAQKDEATPLEHINIFTKDSVQYLANKYKLQKVNLFKIFELNSFKYLISDIYQNFVGKKYLYRK